MTFACSNGNNFKDIPLSRKPLKDMFPEAEGMGP